MRNEEFENWDEARYRELNAYFRVRINLLLESDPYLKDLLAQGKGMQLHELTERMTLEDQQLWQEFLQLDQIKLHRDMHNHLEGRGTPYNSRTGFGGAPAAPDDEDQTW